MNSKEITTATFVDMSKAFGTVNHSILLEKLGKLGIKGDLLRWITSYLFRRSQTVNAGGITSGLRELTCGVPQRSIMGPLLFLVYAKWPVRLAHMLMILIQNCMRKHLDSVRIERMPMCTGSSA